MLLLLFVTVCGSGVGVQSLPLPDSGPHLANDWGEAVRLRHLYAARHGLHLQVHTDGDVSGSHTQSSDSLVEIRPVDTGCVAIKGVASSRFLCMDRMGKLYGSHTYTKEDCSFLERIMPDGYSIYISSKHGALVNLGGAKSKLNSNDANAASQFLPMVNTLSQGPTNRLSGEQRFSVDPEQDHKLGLEIDSADPFGKISQIVIQSPSFNKR
ncbi:fibroblast growth factor 19 [Puntigrus tetrazona]|uniref:fibroblast growth factor 19 n=1 Tax=Puntigrus tetrazona TaxID=1606681 RepID=UPI001C8A9928|nr:fibroblast growth factor 19 [Puntigrus tetrazona]